MAEINSSSVMLQSSNKMTREFNFIPDDENYLLRCIVIKQDTVSYTYTVSCWFILHLNIVLHLLLNQF